MSFEEKQRIYFRVTKWDGTKGVIVDRQNCEYNINPNSLAPECEGQVAVGDVVSGIVKDFETIEDILIERGSKPISERKEFESVGIYSEAKGWTPVTGNPNYSTGTPNTGDSRTRGRR